MLKHPALVREDRQSLTEVWGRKEVWARPSLATLCRAGIRRECAGLSPCLSAPHTARTWQWGEAWPSIIPMRWRAECCPSSDTGHPSLLPTAFYVFFFIYFFFAADSTEGPHATFISELLWMDWEFYSSRLPPTPGRPWLSFPTTWNEWPCDSKVYLCQWRHSFALPDRGREKVFAPR